MPCFIELDRELQAANDNDGRHHREDEASLVAAQERSRAMVVCKIVTPEGVQTVWEAPA